MSVASITKTLDINTVACTSGENDYRFHLVNFVARRNSTSIRNIVNNTNTNAIRMLNIHNDFFLAAVLINKGNMVSTFS